MVSRNTILFTKMMSIDRVTFWYHSRMVGRMPLICPKTGIPNWCMILPFRALRLVPKILSAANMSAHSTGQFVISFESTILVYLHTLGNMIIFCTFLASTALQYSFLVYSCLRSLTVDSVDEHPGTYVIRVIACVHV